MPGRPKLAGIGGLIGLLALALVPSASAAEKPLTRYSIVHGCYSLATGSGDRGGEAKRRLRDRLRQCRGR